MRCLHCDKKLSLLKLAKGDSFCSAEHFDAYQLQISKSAIERLVNLTAEEPRAPLILKARGEPARPEPPETQPSKAPMTAKAREEKQQKAEKPPKAAPARIEGPRGRKDTPQARLAAPPEAPPPAPFAKPGRPASRAPEPPGLVANGPDDSRQEPSLPVHAFETTAGLVNLHHSLARREMGPFNWKSVRQLLFEQEEAALKPVLPNLSLLPDPQAMESFPPQEPASSQAVDRVLSLEDAPVRRPDFPAPAGLSTAPAAPAPVDPRVPFLMAPSFLERQIADGCLDPAASLTANQMPVAVTMGAAKRWPSSNGGIAPSPSLVKAPPAVPRDTARDAVAAASELPPDTGHRLLRGNGKASERKCAVRGLISRETAPRDSPKDSSTGAKFPMDAAPPTPASLLTRPGIAFQESRTMAGLGSKPLRSAQTHVARAMEPADGPGPSDAAGLYPERHGLTSPIALHPGAPAPRSIRLGSLISDAVLGQPRVHEIVFDPPSVPMEFGLHVILASLWPREPLARIAYPVLDEERGKPWRSLLAKLAGQMTPGELAVEPLSVDASFSKKISLPFISQPVKALSLVRLPERDLSWERFDSPLPLSTRPKPMVVQPGARFLALKRPIKAPEWSASPLLRVAAIPPFAGRSDSILEETFLESVHPAVLPGSADSPCVPLRMSKGRLHSAWEPVVPPAEGRPPVKFLPVRRGPIPPAARSWPCLGPPTR